MHHTYYLPLHTIYHTYYTYIDTYHIPLIHHPRTMHCIHHLHHVPTSTPSCASSSSCASSPTSPTSPLRSNHLVTWNLASWDLASCDLPSWILESWSWDVDLGMWYLGMCQMGSLVYLPCDGDIHGYVCTWWWIVCNNALCGYSIIYGSIAHIHC